MRRVLGAALALVLPLAAHAAHDPPPAPGRMSRSGAATFTGGPGGGSGGGPRRFGGFLGGLFGGGGEGGFFGGGGGFGGFDREAGARRFLAIADGTHPKDEEVVVARGTLRSRTDASGQPAGWVAFLAQGDPRSPRAQRRLRRTMTNQNGPRLEREALDSFLGDHGFEGSSIPFSERAHILVVPGVKHFNVASSEGARVTTQDRQLVDELFDIGEKLARDLKLASHAVWQNGPAAASVGQTHIHVTGRYTSASPARDLEPPPGGRPGRLLTISVPGNRVVELASPTP